MLGRVLIPLSLLTLAAYAQDPRGTVTGVVLDSSQAAVPGVEVRATNSETGVTASAKSNAAGNYNIFSIVSDLL